MVKLDLCLGQAWLLVRPVIWLKHFSYCANSLIIVLAMFVHYAPQSEAQR